MPQTFSDRHGYSPASEITVREDAPKELRQAILAIALNLYMKPWQIRNIVCDVLLLEPFPTPMHDPDGWRSTKQRINDCPWYKVYDIAEALYAGFDDLITRNETMRFTDRLNQYFREEGIGWEMRDGQIVYRGSDAFAETTREAVSVLEKSGLPNAASEMREALQDISRRPEPDRTGAIDHAMAALEATAREVTGKPKPTLGKLIPELDLPKPLDIAVDKLWGYASEYARHGKEGRTVGTDETELLVSVACAVCTFLTKRDLHPA